MSTATLSFQIYSSRSDGTQLSTTLDNVPVTGATTKVNIPAYSGVVFLFAQEYDPQGNTLAVNYVSYGVTLDPGTSEPLSVTLQLVPASVALTTTPDLSSATDANKACITVNAQKRSQLFALVPVDADGTYQKAQSAGPNGLGYGVTLSGITNGSDGNGGTSTIVAQSQTWNGYQVYNFVYTPAAGNTSTTPAPAVSATATTPDPRDPQGTGFTESVKIQPGNCTTSSS
ncbi:MAG: hypothetical protein JOZ24_03565 [Candidatus Eremiobacteraeota bacterium]|nr:hypothetical protein [Candidatus Eremiobacteraeota bacterium]